MTPIEAAKFLRLSKMTLYRLVLKRAIPFFKVSGSLRFERADLEEYVLSRRVDSIAQ